MPRASNRSGTVDTPRSNATIFKINIIDNVVGVRLGDMFVSKPGYEGSALARVISVSRESNTSFFTHLLPTYKILVMVSLLC
ncbi:hypothetical protein evm_004187 [Chilo suppressalis]|nr:hypothetical protein evm_004187 [Chilo suppressalis]